MAAVLPLLPERHRAAPRPGLLWALGVAAVAACAVTAALASVNEELYQPALRVLLVWWVTLPYIFAGIVAWRRRPDSFFGPLMILAGFVTQLSILQWTSQPLLNTVGQLCDLLVAAVWLHLFLAYPSGRLAGRRPERVVVIIGYIAALGLQILILLLGGFNDLRLLTVVKRQAAAEAVQNFQLLTLSALALIGVALLWWRWRSLPRWQRRRPAQILINCFSLTLVMLAALLTAGTFQLPGFEIIRLATFTAAGLAPLAFLAGLLDARLAKAGVGELLVRLRTDPARELQELLAQALRDPTLSLIYWLPQYGSWADQDGNPTSLPGPNSDRRVTLVKQNGEQVAALVYDAALGEEPELVEAVSAAAGIALENGRLEAELRARLQELQGSRSRVVEAQQNERRRLERNLHDVRNSGWLPSLSNWECLPSSLTNAVKHARADRVTVAAAVSNDTLVVEIADDGIGGADSERGTGLRGLADRIEALDGRLRVWSSDKGTRVRAEIPCG